MSPSNDFRYFYNEFIVFFEQKLFKFCVSRSFKASRAFIIIILIESIDWKIYKMLFKIRKKIHYKFLTRIDSPKNDIFYQFFQK